VLADAIWSSSVLSIPSPRASWTLLIGATTWKRFPRGRGRRCVRPLSICVCGRTSWPVRCHARSGEQYPFAPLTELVRRRGLHPGDKTEYEPNHLWVMSLPDPTLITEMAEAACTALEWGTLRWLTIGGHDLSVFDATLRDVYARMPKKGDAG
jgi:hypothetical protein